MKAANIFPVILAVSLLSSVKGFLISNMAIRACQRETVMLDCPILSQFLPPALNIRSVTFRTSSNIVGIENATRDSPNCLAFNECDHTAMGSPDDRVPSVHMFAYEFIMAECQGKTSCNFENFGAYELAATSPRCSDGQLMYFASLQIDAECRVAEEIATVAPPPPFAGTTIEPPLLTQHFCQGEYLHLQCSSGLGFGMKVLDIKSLAILSGYDSEYIANATADGRNCLRSEDCRSTIYNTTDADVSADYMYWYDSIMGRCQGTQECGLYLPTWSELTDNSSTCMEGRTVYLAAVVVEAECRSEGEISTVPPPPPRKPPGGPITTTYPTPPPELRASAQPESEGH